MCGRFSFVAPKEKIEQQFKVILPDSLELNYNIAPTQASYVIGNDAPEKLQQMYWGLVPYWSNEGTPSGKLINARKEGIGSKPSFRIPIRERRCLVLADSFYEWKRVGQRKLPYRILLQSEKLMAFAGIWDVWAGPDNKSIKTFSIITTKPNQEVSTVHNRMPVILADTAAQEKWLSAISLAESVDMLNTLADDQLKLYRVSEKLNTVKSNDLELHKEVPELPSLF